VTNPANGFGRWIPDEYWNTVEWDTSSSWLGFLFRPQDTSYGLFLLTKTINGISITGLLNTIDVCEFDSEDELVGHLCGWIGKSTRIHSVLGATDVKRISPVFLRRHFLPWKTSIELE
jgi:hypothetical protein